MELEEGRGEDLRLLYVALTRAQHRAVVWWAGAQDSEHSPLARIMFDRDERGVVSPYGARHRADDDVEAAFAALAPFVDVVRVDPPAGGRLHLPPGTPPDLHPAVFDRTLDAGWRRVSYSGITRPLHEGPTVGSEPEAEAALTSDESAPPVLPAPATAPDARRDIPLLLGAMPGGTLVGTVVHGVFEHTDFAATDLEAEVRDALAKEVAWRQWSWATPRRWWRVCAPLSRPRSGPWPRASGSVTSPARPPRRTRLRHPARRGCAAAGRLDVADLADLLEAHLPADDPVARYAPSLRNPALSGALRGYLTGSLDLVLRLPDGRFVIADYKTNRLGPPGEALTGWHYRTEAVEEEMAAAHYPLQALLYSIALHRYLRWRLPDYDAATHLGGVLYLFVRGMSAVEAEPAPGGHRSGCGPGRPRLPWSRPSATCSTGAPAHDRRRRRGPVRRGSGAWAPSILGVFNRAGVLSTSDVHVALTLARLGAVEDEAVWLGAALAARAPRLGPVCVDLDSIAVSASADTDVASDLAPCPGPTRTRGWTIWPASPLVGDDRPLHLEGSNLYLDRLWTDEVLVSTDLRAPGRAARAASTSPP